MCITDESQKDTEVHNTQQLCNLQLSLAARHLPLAGRVDVCALVPESVLVVRVQIEAGQFTGSSIMYGFLQYCEKNKPWQKVWGVIPQKECLVLYLYGAPQVRTPPRHSLNDGALPRPFGLSQ